MNSKKHTRSLEVPDPLHPSQRIPYCLVTLACRDGFSASLCSLGASIRRIDCPWPSGALKNIALSFAQDSAYLSNPLYAGATLAPCAGRISQGRLPIPANGSFETARKSSINESFETIRETSVNETSEMTNSERICLLTRNENGRHTLHGGLHNASFQNWPLLSLSQTETAAQASFGLTLADGLDGFPGNRQLKATYTLNEEHTLTLKLEAISDQDTYFNLSNHCYFNLSGDFSKSAADHLLQIQADRYIRNAPDFIPEGIGDVTNTPFDFRQPRTLKAQAKAWPADLQLARNQGYNHGFILEHRNSAPDLICEFPGSPWRLSVSSDAPCMVLYSGGYIQEGLPLADGQTSRPGCALAFEFQDYPDAPGGHGFPYHTTPAGVAWERTICYDFQ